MIRVKYGIVLICIIIFISSCNKDVNEKKTEESRDETETTEEMRETYVIKSNNEIFTNTFYAGVNKIEADMYLRGKRLELTEKEEILKVCACFSELEFIEKIKESDIPPEEEIWEGSWLEFQYEDNTVKGFSFTGGYIWYDGYRYTVNVSQIDEFADALRSVFKIDE
ncbi:hypothetical protein AALB81_11315 [Lachnospiraceae bacterium 48-33]